jgi:hypothetical protein
LGNCPIKYAFGHPILEWLSPMVWTVALGYFWIVSRGIYSI